MTINRFIVFIIGCTLLSTALHAQGLRERLSGTELTAEAQAGISDGKTPLWLNANRYGLSTLDKKNGYVRLSVLRPLLSDSAKNWRLGYGLDIAVATNHTRTMSCNQAYIEGNYKKITLTAGAKRRLSPMTNQELSSGAMTYGWNSLPIPQLALDIDWFSVPGTNNILKVKIHGSYGMTTDGSWQKDVSVYPYRYTGNVLYHEKAMYLKFGKETRFPLTYELGLQMGAQFGGTTYNGFGRGYNTLSTIKHNVTLKSFIHALTASGNDETDGTEPNTAGNHFGSWIMRLTYHSNDWKADVRFERFFDDQSMMFVQYGIYDHLIGIDAWLPKNPFLSCLTLEHLSTTDQSGAVYHDKTINMPEKMNGRDDYYNHNLYTGLHHWGQAFGNPILTSPIYNSDGNIIFKNNRVSAFHIGLMGNPATWIQWKLLATFTENRGTYSAPFANKVKQQYYLAEATLSPKVFKGWNVRMGIGVDHGAYLGNNTGCQLTVSRSLTLIGH